jgi:hypothetical protein
LNQKIYYPKKRGNYKFKKIFSQPVDRNLSFGYYSSMEEVRIKTCANCKHFKIVKKGMEIKNILDTSYIISECKIKKWRIKEYYLDVKTPIIIEDSVKEVCEFWEEYKPPFFKIFRR